ncbi:hypothetical protein IWX75_003444 [Arthrobacter sp. CAN_A6]
MNTIALTPAHPVRVFDVTVRHVQDMSTRSASGRASAG